jgi:type II secretory pathway component PulF
VARFAYQASDATGRLVRGVQLADSEAELDRILTGMQLCLIDFRVASARRRRRVPPQLMVDLCYHLGSAVEGGIPLIDALQDFCGDDDNPLAEVMGDVARKVRNGAQLSDALGDYPQIFPDLMRSLLRAGEHTGKLDLVLRDLARYLEWRDQLRHQIRSALAYPCVVLGGIFVLCILLVTYVLPSFLEIFRELGVELPPLARGLLAVSELLRSHALAFLLGALVLGFAVWRVLRSARGREVWHAALLRLPLVGRLVTMLEMARFSHNLGVLYAAGIPIVDALRMIRDIVQNVRIRRVIDSALESLRGGGALADALEREQLIPRLVVRMLAIGEASGRLDQSLERASAFYDRELPRTIARTLAVFNTLSVVLLGVAVTGMALSIFVPLYSMLGEINAGS